MKHELLTIQYARPDLLSDCITVNFRIYATPIAQRWAAKVLQAQQHYAIDDAARFYGFGTWAQQAETAVAQLNACVDQLDIPITRRLTSVHDQDTLNYLHHVFETHHGLLDAAPVAQQAALCNLNILVHRCESVQRGALPRHVVTYYGLPKTDTLETQDYANFTCRYRFGTVYLNYAEIGKTLEDLAWDNDQYISAAAFQPFRHYSADFNVKFFDLAARQIVENRAKIVKYYKSHEQFFMAQGLTMQHPWMRAGSIPVARILDPDADLLEKLVTRQFVKAVHIT